MGSFPRFETRSVTHIAAQHLRGRNPGIERAHGATAPNYPRSPARLTLECRRDLFRRCVFRLRVSRDASRMVNARVVKAACFFPSTGIRRARLRKAACNRYKSSRTYRSAIATVMGLVGASRYFLSRARGNYAPRARNYSVTVITDYRLRYHRGEGSVRGRPRAAIVRDAFTPSLNRISPLICCRARARVNSDLIAVHTGYFVASLPAGSVAIVTCAVISFSINFTRGAS